MRKKKSLKARYWSLGIVLFLINYLIFATLFTFLFEADFNTGYATRTPVPTFTPVPAEPIIIVPTPVPVTPQPSPTATRVIGASESNAGPGASTSEGIIQASALQPDPQPANGLEKSTYQYEPIDWYAEENPELTSFSGEIKDTSGHPVNGVSVQVRCGNYSVISQPSGAAKLGQPGFYEMTIDTKPIPCIWFLTIIDTDDGEIVKALLSEPVPVEITQEKSVVIANWRKISN